jgi:hypothetical protein
MNPSNAANERLAQAVAMSEVELADLVLRASDAYLAAYRVADVQGLTADRLEAISELGAGYAVDLACAARYIAWARAAGAQVPDDVERAVLQMCVSFVLLGTLASNTNAAETLRSLSSPAEIGQLSTDARAWLAARASA